MKKMNDNSAVLFAYAVAALAELEAMKLQNAQDEKAGRPLTYQPMAFWNVQTNMEGLIRDYR